MGVAGTTAADSTEAFIEASVASALEIVPYLPPGDTRLVYQQTLTVRNGQPPFRWQISADSLPPGITFDEIEGTFSGRPQKSGLFPLMVEVVDARNMTASSSMALLIRDDSYSIETWGRVFDGALPKVPRALTVDRGGYVLVAATEIDQAAGTERLVLIKYDSLGKLVWNRFYSEPSISRPAGIAVDRGGDIYLAGGGAVPSGFRLLKLASNGELMWERVVGAAEGAQPGGLVLKEDGYISVSGTAGGEVLTVLFDSTGATVWERRHRTGLASWGSDVAADGYGNLFVAGGWSDGPDARLLVLKYSPVGDLIWTMAGDPGEATAVLADQKGNGYVSRRAPKAELLKLNALGTPLWSVPVEADGRILNIEAIAQDEDDRINAVGWFLEEGAARYGVSKIQADGKVLFLQETGGDYQQRATSIWIEEKYDFFITRPLGKDILTSRFHCPSFPSIDPVSLPEGRLQTPYQITLAGDGGTPPYFWSPQSGNLPPGISLDEAGAISGTPEMPGFFAFTAMLVDGADVSATAAFTLRITAPDLEVSDLQVPEGTGPGLTLTIRDTVRNRGDSSVGRVTFLDYILSSDALADGGDVSLGAREIPDLAPGESQAVLSQLSVPEVQPGFYYLLALADRGDDLPEEDESNNSQGARLPVGPDLTLSDWNIPNYALPGTVLRVTLAVTNSGFSAAGTTTTAFYLSRDIELDAADLLLGAKTVNVLAPAAAETVITDLLLPAGTQPGKYFLLIQVDSGQVQGELREDNNLVAVELMTGCDLVVSSLSVPSKGGAGAYFAITDSTSNIGGGGSPASVTRFYLSKDTIFDGGDLLLGSRNVKDLPAGGKETTTTTLLIPSHVVTGTYHVIAKADGDGQVPESSETNNQRLSLPVKIGPDFVISSLKVPVAAAAGQIFNLSDVTANDGAGAAETSVTGYYLSSDTIHDSGDVRLGERFVPALGAGAENTGSMAVSIPEGTLTGIYYILALADDDDKVAETNEGNNLRSSMPVKIGPDLSISSLSVPGKAAAGQAVTVNVTTVNIGAGGSPPSVTRFYVSRDTVYDQSDLLFGGMNVVALPAGGRDISTASVTFPGDLSTGTYFVIARADGDEQLAETNETNNVRVSLPVKIGPDLNISSLVVPATAAAGQTVSVTDTTSNSGSGAAGRSVSRYYLSMDNSYDARDLRIGGREVSELAAGASQTGGGAVLIPLETLAGSYFILAMADGDEQLEETDETNNIRSSLPIKIGPDLSVSSLLVPPMGAAGQSILVSDNTINNGSGEAGGSITGYYLSVDNLFDGNDIRLGSRAVVALAGGAGHSGSTTLLLPEGTATGTYYVIARADADEQVAESTETNNLRLSSVVKIGPDLTVSSVKAPPKAAAGQPITVTDTTVNSGSGSAGASITGWYLSVDNAFDSSDLRVGGRAVSALSGGERDEGNSTVVIPDGTATGSYFLIAQADIDLQVIETTESNNRRTSSMVKIGPDLGVSSLIVPSAGAAGHSMTITDTTVNSGGGSAGESVTAFYLSTDNIWDSGDTKIGERSITALPGGGILTGNAAVTIPGGTVSGSYYIIAFADADRQTLETSEENNWRSSLPVKIGPDLVISSLKVPSAAGAGQSIIVTVTTYNSGAGQAEQSMTACYLSTDTILNAGDERLGERSIAPISGGGSETESITLVIPEWTPTGSYYILSLADSEGQILETNEGNNLRSSLPVKIGPDLTVSSFSAPRTAAVGDLITVTDITANSGAGFSGASVTRYYLSSDTIFDSEDTLLGERTVSPLVGGTNQFGSATLSTPEGTALGSYYILARADDLGQVNETNENNNVRYSLALKIE